MIPVRSYIYFTYLNVIYLQQMKKFVLNKEENIKRPEDFQIPYNDVLNSRQLEAVMFGDGPALVIAGAGTGKTRTLIYRVARLIESGIRPEQLLLLTFTRRAASEMLNRASKLLDDRCRNVRGGTFHFYCSQLLHKYASFLSYPDNFTIIDASDAIEVLQLIRSELNYNKLKERFPKKNTLYSILSTAVNKQLSVHEVIDEQYPQFLHHVERIEELSAKYALYKETNHVMDFDDLLVKTRDLLRENEQIRVAEATRNRYVLVDEYQDTNALQAGLVALFSSRYHNVMAVGDDAQSIYSFRGADHRNIMQFPEQFPGTKIIKLEENYRSTKRILDLTNIVLDKATSKYDKRLFTQNEAGELPALVKAPDERDQSRFITQMILNLREQDFDLSDIAVLFRNGRDSFDLEIELNQKKIPFIKFGGQKFSEAAHIKDVLAHVRVIVNPMDAIAWNRLLRLLDGIGPKTASDLVTWLRQQDNPYEIGASKLISERYIKQIYNLSTLLQDLKNKNYSVAETIRHIVDYYKPICEKQFDDYPKRIKDLEAFTGISENYASLPKLLEELSLDPIEATAVDTETSQKDENPLVLSTIHSAKGLEWNNVFIIQCLDGVIPSGFSIKNETELDEELRLLYVACTRAKSNLFITYPVIQNASFGEYFSNPSRFIQDIDENYLEPWLLVEESEPQNNRVEENRSNLLPGNEDASD